MSSYRYVTVFAGGGGGSVDIIPFCYLERT